MIEFTYNNKRGRMRFDPDMVIDWMPLHKYRKWIKLFVPNTTREQQRQFTDILYSRYERSNPYSAAETRYQKMITLFLREVWKRDGVI